ncbi:MAG: Glutamine--fructose-6-phosphate aminotransferase (isomerizing) [Candidatus Hydrogenedentes bacterium ADurb.Bin170]|jgi:glucosamine--fructose-6-phosphate aminotransferase (isomerizing)|nr:MAG: Glutamine--fructose-6-phosphate aminotransferase (isomerizing) [Candidatus Hydrogenedentes bacterium ADurb.Bin170]
MSGVVGYIGDKNPVEVLVAGLYRIKGHDSAGVAVVNDEGVTAVKSLGKLENLEAKLAAQPVTGHLGIGHARWATHGVPNETNAHPHFDALNEIAVVHNGIIENYQELRTSLQQEGVAFRSQTDSETLAHLIRKYYQGNLFKAVQQALRCAKGAWALGVVSRHNPDVLIVARQGSPVVVGVGDNEAFMGSDVSAIIKYTRDVVYLDHGQICEVRRDGIKVEDLDGNPVQHEVVHVDWDDSAAEKDGFPHFMLKEIHQQPEVIRNTLRGRISDDASDVNLSDINISEADIKACPRITIVACGTSWHAGMVGKYLIERFAEIPVELDLASEYRYRDPIVEKNAIVIPVSQSGETADTMEAVRLAKSQGARILAVVNTVGSSVARESNGVIYLQAGPEVSIASTKAYTTQVTAFALLTIWLARIRGTMTKDQAKDMIAELRTLPDKMQLVLNNQEPIKALAGKQKYRDAQSAFFLGRDYNYPSALEGSLKLKEVSYIHAEAYPAGELKHGPIALVTNEMPVICVAPKGNIYDKMVSNIQSIKARAGLVISIATEGDTAIQAYSDDVLYIPECYEPFSPILVALPLQLFAYYVAVNRGCDVDQPRNLAKSVIVE